MLKKISIAAIAFSAMFTVNCFGFTDVTEGKLLNAVTQLQEMGVISGYPDDTFRPKNSITRAEFATMIVTLTNNLSAYRMYGQFQDVPDGHWAEDAIYIAKALNIVSGTSETLFSPDATITYQEAIKMIISALGYEDQAINRGGYPNGYMKVAQELELLKNITVNQKGNAQRGVTAIILEKATNVPFYIIYNDGKVLEKTKSEETLQQLFNASKIQ